jgi:hypothetical protein
MIKYVYKNKQTNPMNTSRVHESLYNRLQYANELKATWDEGKGEGERKCEGKGETKVK